MIKKENVYRKREKIFQKRCAIKKQGSFQRKREKKKLFQYYKKLFQYYFVLLYTTLYYSSTTPVLLRTAPYYKVLLRNTKYYSSTTLYYTVLLPALRCSIPLRPQYHSTLAMHYKYSFLFYKPKQSTSQPASQFGRPAGEHGTSRPAGTHGSGRPADRETAGRPAGDEIANRSPVLSIFHCPKVGHAVNVLHVSLTMAFFCCMSLHGT